MTTETQHKIETKDLVIYKSERLTDNEDGGGKYSGQVIIDGQSNNLFNDISELNRTEGNVSMRKVFPSVVTQSTDTLMGATVFISENPKDPNVSALLFSTGSFTDQRSSAQGRVENYLAKAGQIAGVPLDTHLKGMKTIQVAMFLSETESAIGDAIVLVSNEGKATQFEQFLKITKVETRTTKLITDQKEFEYKIATYGLNDALSYDFVGLSARQWYNNEKSTTIVRATMVADAGIYYGSSDLTETASVGEYTVHAKSIFSQIIPSAQTETAIIDVNAAGESVALTSGNNDAITVNFSTTVGVSQNLYIGIGVMPSSVSFSLFGQSVTDQGGLLKNSLGTQVGTIDYQKGLIQWTESATAGATTLVITFRPAAAPTQYFQTSSIPVTQANQGSNWTGVLVPTPSPGSLSVSYMSQGKFYELKDDGSGQLRGSSTSFGSGVINFETGSWLITTGALPDVGTPILLLWGTQITSFVRANLPVEKAGFDFDLEEDGILANSVVATWTLEGVAKSATSNSSGKFTGDATGEINYATGKGRIIPNKLPQKNTVFTLNYSHGLGVSQNITSITADANHKLSFNIGNGAAIQPNTVELTIPVQSEDLQQESILTLKDSPINASTGNLIDGLGNVQGVITYSSGLVQVTPFLNTSALVQKYELVFTVGVR